MSGKRPSVVVVGAGAAGLLGAVRTAECGCPTRLIEKNRKPGVKILMSGGTRCNLTHNTDRRGIVEAFGKQGRFLHSALAALGPRELVALFEAEGVATKCEETGKIFPVSNKATDVLEALLRRLHRSGAELSLSNGLKAIERIDQGFRLFTANDVILADRVLITVGGQSYPGSGTTGDGYAWAKSLGHTIVPPRPALTPVTSSAAWIADLKGITIPDVIVKLLERTGGESSPSESASSLKKPLDERRGSFLFTHFGLSGPAPMDISRSITAHPHPSRLDLLCNFLPHWNAEQLREQIQRECTSGGKRQIGNVVGIWLPDRLVHVLLQHAGIDPDRKAAEVGKQDRQRLVAAIQSLPIPVSGTRGFEKAEVTAGGVALDEVDSTTMESKIVPGLYFAGEILDLDGPIGGFNFQSAFSTAWLAGKAIAQV